MSSRIRAHIRNNVVGYIAVFIALSGTAWATHPGGANTISSGDIINEEVHSSDIANLEVKGGDIAPDAVASPKLLDGGVKGVDVLDNTLKGTDVDESSLNLTEPWTEVTAGAGCNVPAVFCNGWTNRPNGQNEDFESVGFYRDRAGLVHLKGLARQAPGGANAIFRLPPGYQPAKTLVMPVNTGGGPGRIDVDIDPNPSFSGAVIFHTGTATDYVALDGISFRCGPSGQDGCP